MEYIKSNNVNPENTFFHFTRIDNRKSIEEFGLRAVAGGEHGVAKDREHKTIYFSKGYFGLLKAVDVWARWEYCRYARRENYKSKEKRVKNDYESRLVQGKDDSYDKDIMREVIFNKLYHDFKNSQFYAVDFKEGKDGDFEYGDIDYKKVLCRNRFNEPLYSALWQYGQYSDFGTPENPNNKQEDWNMNTKDGERSIPQDRLKIIETENGRSDGISVIIEAYEKYRHTLFLGNDELYEILDNFVAYAKERYKNDIDFKDGTLDYGRREINPNEESKYQEINGIKHRRKSKEKNMSNRDENFVEMENRFMAVIRDNIKELDSKQFESISQINELLGLLGEKDFKIPRSVITLNNKINELALHFEKAGTSLFVSESKETNLIVPSFVGNAVIHDLIDMACGTSDSLCKFSSILIDASKERDKRVNAIVTASPLKRFMWQVRSLFGQKVQLNTSLTPEEEEKLSDALDKYRDKDNQIFKYELKDNIQNAIVKEVRALMSKGTFSYFRRLDKDNISGFIKDNITPDLEKLGFESLIPKIEEAIIKEHARANEQENELPKTNETDTKKKPDMDPID